MKAAVLAISLAMLPLSVLAEDAGGWVIPGIGNDSCASFVLALNDNSPTAAIQMEGKTYFTMANAYTQWLNGYVTGINSLGKPGKGQINVDVNGIALWVRNYCEAHPSEALVYGAGAFVREHRPRGSK